MKHHKPEHSFTEVLNTSALLKEMAHKAVNLAKLNQAVQKKLDPQLASHCRVTNLRDGVLILTTPSPAFGHTLRFQEIELLSALRQEPEWCGLSSIQSRVRPEVTLWDMSPRASVAPNNPKPAKPKLTSFAASTLQSSAEGITSPRLRESMLRLASKYS